MPSSPKPVGIPTSPVVDIATGLPTPEWLVFFQTLMDRTSGAMMLEAQATAQQQRLALNQRRVPRRG